MSRNTQNMLNILTGTWRWSIDSLPVPLLSITTTFEFKSLLDNALKMIRDATRPQALFVLTTINAKRHQCGVTCCPCACSFNHLSLASLLIIQMSIQCKYQPCRVRTSSLAVYHSHKQLIMWNNTIATFTSSWACSNCCHCAPLPFKYHTNLPSSHSVF